MGNDPRYSKSRTFDPFPFPHASEKQKSAISAIAEKLDLHRKRVLAEHPDFTLTGLYNVLEKLRAGTRPDDLLPDDRRVFDHGFVLILKELHDGLDQAVAEAYGWSPDLSDDEILMRLVALNRERATEEAAGQVRWLRPDYQIPLFGTLKEKKQQLEADLIGTEGTDKKPLFPTDDMGQTAVVMAALADSIAPLTSTVIATRFKQGRRIETKVAAVLSSLARMGIIGTAGASGAFHLRRPG
jgi:hypothetical protein